MLSLLQIPAIGCQWFCFTFADDRIYDNLIASSRTFCVYEEVGPKSCFSLFGFSHYLVLYSCEYKTTDDDCDFLFSLGV